MGEYHQYLYDFEGGRITGDYESAYANCPDVHPSQHEVDTFKHRVIRQYLRRMEPGSRVLDVGCGYGDFVEDLSGRGLEVSGCDVSPSAIEQGRTRFPACRLEVGDITGGLPYGDQSYDALLLLGVFWFLLDRLDFCLGEMERLLTPGGLVFCSLGFPRNQKLGKDVIPSPEHLHRILAEVFTIEEFVVIYHQGQLKEGRPLEQCDCDCLVVARKGE